MAKELTFQLSLERSGCASCEQSPHIRLRRAVDSSIQERHGRVYLSSIDVPNSHMDSSGGICGPRPLGSFPVLTAGLLLVRRWLGVPSCGSTISHMLPVLRKLSSGQ